MNLSQVLLRSVAVAALCLIPAAAISAAPPAAATGMIAGRVFNPSTSEYVRNAEVRIDGTTRTTTTENDGSFRFADVATGPVTLVVSYTGYDTVRTEVSVTADSPARPVINLASSFYKDEGPVKLDAVTVSAEREGNAKAIMDQRQAMTVSNIVAAETFGNIAEGNVGEFVKYLPGIQLDYVEADARSPRIRGLPAQFTTVTFDGMKLASADGFIQNNGTDNGGGAGAGSRSFGFEQVSLSSIDAVEVNFTTNASQDADSPAGNINLRPKHAYERNRQLFAFDVSAFGNSEQLYWKRTVGPDDRLRRKILPNANLEYSNSFWNHRVGLILGLNESNSYNEQRQFQPAYDTTPTPTDPRPVVLTRLQFKDGPKFSERSTFSFGLDFRATERLSLSLLGMLSNYDASVGNRSFGVNSSRANVGGDGWTWDNVRVTSFSSTTMAYLKKRTHGYSYLPTFDYKLANLDLSGALMISASENNYNGGQSKNVPGNTVGGTSIPTTGMTVTATRPADDLYAWRIVETAGTDWGDIGAYKAGATGYPTFSVDGRYNRNLIYQGRLDAKYSTGLSIPTWFKVGGKITETTYVYQNPTAWQTWNYVGPGGGLAGNWAMFPSQFEFSPGHGGSILSTTGRTPAVQDHNAIGDLFARHPEYFVPGGTAANYLAAFVQQPKYVKEQVDALYAMVNTRPLRQLELQGGVRWERTRDELKDFDPIGSAKVVAAGFPVTASTGVASTIPGIQYQYFSQPRIARSKSYGKLFPSVSGKYTLTTNLQALVGYSYTVTRPAYGDLAGVYQENDQTQEITAPNPNLKPQYANNYSARLTYYFEPVGSFGVGVFENDFKNFVQSQKIQGIAGDYGYTDPLYATYTVNSKQNIPGTVVYRGATVEYMQALPFMPRDFKGSTVFANYTRTYTRIELPDPSMLNAAAPYNYGWLPGVSPNVVNAGVNLRFRRVSLRLNAKWTDKTGTTSTYNTWMAANTKIDAGVTYSLTNRYSLYLSGRNIFNTPDHTFVGTNPQQIGGGRAFEYYGAYFYAGVRGRF